MKLNVKKFAELTGVSVRTLHYYDEIGLLTPSYINNQNGYRFYGDKEFCKMQEIMFYRELDFSLKDITAILSSPNYNKQEALRGQKQLLILKKQRLENIIKTIECAEKGIIIDMSNFNNNEFEKAKEIYCDEAKKRWGNTEAYAEYEKRTAEYQNADRNKVGEGINSIISEFAESYKKGVKAADEAAIALAKKLQKFITDTQYTCTNNILLSLGEMYVGDERFKANIDKYGEGTAEFINASIKAYCNY